HLSHWTIAKAMRIGRIYPGHPADTRNSWWPRDRKAPYNCGSVRPDAAQGRVSAGGNALPPPTHMFEHQRPKAAGLYDPAFEHDACGIGAVARLDNRREHEVVERAIQVLLRLE